MRRVEFQTLKPGDWFEYENPMRQRRGMPMRDRVLKQGVTARGGARIFRSDVTNHFVDGTSEVSAITMYTEHGMSGHGYVRLAPDAVVLLLRKGD